MCACASAISAGSVWPQFRGSNSAGVADSDRPPVQFGPATNLVWGIELPQGLSSPCVWQDRIFLTAYADQKLESLCVRSDDGRILWRRVAPIQQVETTDPKGGPASATPATNGKAVYVYLGSYGVLAYDFDGQELWRKPMPIPNLPYGSGTSPALMEDYLLINRDQEDGKSLLLALDAHTGQTVWKAPRPEFRSSYSTPVLWRREGVAEVVLAGSYRLVGYDLTTGKERWLARGLEGFDVCPTPAIGDDQLYAMSYSFGGGTLPTFATLAKDMDKDEDHKLSREEARSYFSATGWNLVNRNRDDFISKEEWEANLAALNEGEHGIFAVRAPGTGDITTTHIAWRQKRGAATVSSPLFYRGHIYVVQDGGRVSCYESKSGKPLYEQERLGAEGEYYASPISANGRIYFASTRGVVSVIEAGEALNVLARNDLAERIMATPAIAADTLYVRTATCLWAFGRPRRQ